MAKQSNTRVDEKEPISVLICPGRDLRVESRLDIVVVANLNELVTLVNAESQVLAIDDVKLLKMFIEYSDLFNVSPAVLIGVPGCDYTPAFENIVWSLDKVGYDNLIVEAETQSRMEMLKDAERPKNARIQRDGPQTAEEVADLRVPNGVDYEEPDVYE